ncbi:MAG TPA: hypothetical protein VHD59_02100 [Pseudolabrys sp.]|jgi:hypothetical protein|nr:hypothetical protein [Pseudolabrys sp.]
MRRGCIFAIAIALSLLAGPAAFGQGNENMRTDAPEPQASVPPDANEPECLNRQEQRMAVRQGAAIRLGVALRSISAQDGDELLRAQLCRHDRKLVYVLTLLTRTGKVSRAIVDARSGDVVKDR